MSALVGAEVLDRAVANLRVRGDAAAADLLASCTLDVVVDAVGDVGLDLVGPLVTAPGPLDLAVPLVATLAQALRDALPPDVWMEHLVARPADAAHTSPTRPPDLPATTATPLNQAVGELAPRTWAGMRFRSESELRVAQALDRAGALFFPDALARLGPPRARQNREADFLVCWQGMWGILEVDGAPFHGQDREVADAERDQLFRQHGLEVVEHVDAAHCFATPDAVVTAFLAIFQQQRSS
jgi:hypothetical protein